MTTRERLIIMQDIKRKNDISWSRYAQQPRQHTTMKANAKKPFTPFSSTSGFCVLLLCIPALLVLFLMMAA